MKVDLSRPVPNKVKYLPSRLTRTSDQRLRYSLPREQDSETPSLFLRSNERSADSPRESFVEGGTVCACLSKRRLYTSQKKEHLLLVTLPIRGSAGYLDEV
jgi:hypothetical protein